MRKLSKKHSNRQHYNWLLYDIGDHFIWKFAHLYEGVLIDLGCGEGPYKDFFEERVEKYIGVDWSSTFHNSAADIESDLNQKIALNDKTANVAIALSVLEHLYNPNKFLSETYRVLKDDGVLVMQVPWQWWIHEAPHDYFRYTPYALKMLLNEAGFGEVEIHPQTGFFTTWLIKLNYFSLRFIRGPRFIRRMIKFFLIPIWYINQSCAPMLDKLDRDWNLETQGYFLIARKTRIGLT